MDNFIADAVRIDGDAAEVINRNKDEFYDKYNYLKPDCEKNLWEKICDGFAAAGEWCKEHWKFVVTIVLAVAAVVLICTGVGGPFAAIILGAAKGLLTGAVTGGLMGGISSLAAGGSFFEGFEDGAFMGALTGALFGGIGGAGEALGALGKLGTTCEALGRLEKLAKISGTISLGMGTFDLLAWGAGLFAPDNAFTAFNWQLHSNSLYNAFQFGAGALAVFSLGGIKGFYEKTPNPVCFVAGTMVLAASGLTAIENIRAGDKVISTNADTFETEEKTVLETYIRRTDKLIHLVINGEEIITTETHPFYVKERGFVDAGSLLIGDPLIDVHGNILVVENTRTEYLDEPETVYNFQVEDFHTYYVGANCIFVHNAGDLYRRSGFRKSTNEKAVREAPRNEYGEMICPTCGKAIPEKITIQTKNGPKIRRGYDLDHYPSTWNERVNNMKMRATQPSRKEVLDIYNESVRVQCPKCNQGHRFEGIKGDFSK